MATLIGHLVARHPGPGRRQGRPPVEQGRPPPALPGRHRQGRQPRRQARVQRLHRRVAQDRSAPCGDDIEAEVAAEAERLEAEYDKHRLAELIQSGGVAGGPALRARPRDHREDRRDMTDTVVSSATREVVIGFDRPFVIIGERINPTGRKLLAEEMKAGDFSRVERDVARPGRGRRPHARRQRRHPARRRAGDPGPDDPARPVA